MTGNPSSPVPNHPSSSEVPISTISPTSVNAQPESSGNRRLGMERGYALSPMYSLILEYNREQGSSLSTAAEVSWILQQPNLKTKDIIISDDESDPDTIIRLADTRFERVLRAVTELQTFLDRMAELIQERTTVFRIDPQETMTIALQGCESRSQLELAYGILLKRLLVAQQTVAKYEAQYQHLETPLSPVSTVPELHEEFDRIGTVDGRMRLMLQKFPHHQEQLNAGALTAVAQGRPWSVIHPTQPLPTKGESQQFQPAKSDVSAGKKKVDWDDTAPWDEKLSSVEQGRDLEGSTELSFGFQTPFRTNTRFFDTSGTPSAPFFSTPGDMIDPNPVQTQDVTLGLATPSRTVFGDNVRDHSATTNQPSNAMILSRRNAGENSHTPNSFDAPLNNNPSPSKRGPSRDDDPPNAQGDYPPGNSGGPPGGGGGSGGGGGGGGGGHFPSPSFPNNHNYPTSNGQPSPSGGGGNPGGGGGGGGGGEPPHPGGQIGPPAPYGNMPATMKTELKVEQLPEWDGNHWTAIEYFWQVQQLAHLGGWIPEALGYWLWFRLKDGSPVKKWFVTLPLTHQSYMRSHYLKFLKGVKDGYLGHRWQIKMNNYYNSQTFRERNHERESPSDFILRRIIYTRMLLSVNSGGPLEVFYIMRKAPISWGPILLVSSIKDSSELYSRVTEHEEALLEAYRVSKGGQTSSIDQIAIQLRQMGFVQENQRSYPRRANLTQNATEENPASKEDANIITSLQDFSSPQHILHKAYQVLQQRQRPPPKGGYPFPKNDHVTTRMGKMPPSPCKVCGSANHWDKECPDWNVYLEKAKRSANAVEIWSEDESEKTYATAYSILLNEKLAESVVNEPFLQESLSQQQDFRVASLLAQVSALGASKSGTHESLKAPTRATMEEIEDEDWLAQKAKPKASKNLLEEIGSDEEAHEDVEPNFRSPPIDDEIDELSRFEESTSSTPNADDNSHSFATESREPPALDTRIKLKKRRFAPAGASAAGVSVVAVQGWVGSTRNTRVDLRLDSCADVTLISQEYLESLKDRPPCQKGAKMNLWQLTDKDSTIQGYVRIPIIMESSEGILLETEAEAYVVPNMTVPILLGEDYHLNYELIVAHKIDFRSVVNFAGVPYSVPARGVSRTRDFDRMRQSASANASFVKSKLHKRNKAKTARQKKKLGFEQRTVRAAEDYRLRPDECRRIKVEGHFGEDRTWLVEKNVLASANDSPFIVPNVLISASDPWIPISNPSAHPRLIRKGDIIGYLTDPQEYFDAPLTQEGLDKFTKSAQAVAAVIAISSEKLQQPTSPGTSTTEESSASPKGASVNEEQAEEAELFGPKTAELPDLTNYPSQHMEEYLDVGSLPESLKERAWEMLRKRQRAFGFDGRLGHHPSKVHIRTRDGQVPIAVPMYGSSPAKRVVMDEQLDKWFEQDVIEPSKSPWSAPVVIAYRHGKPRFCVDYRKLNAATIPDEFPIPRQSEILSSLSGAQVLSSLDALSGFTQLEMDEEDVEKTAFRTHRGLFQFKRMPFGLCNGPSIFQRVMQGILAPYLWIFCLVYIDDIVIYSKSYEDHIDHLDKVLEAIENAGITLSPVKCHLFYSSILLLGHKVSRLGLSTHTEKVRAVLELQSPTKLSQLQTFLGMAVYFSAFIPYYADRCYPLFQLLRKGAKWLWSAECETAFNSIKSALQEAPVLGHPQEGLPYRLYTDASDEALGCALQQVQPIAVKDLKNTRLYSQLKKAFEAEKKPPRLVVQLPSALNDNLAAEIWGETFDDTMVYIERVIAYWSRTFKSAETRYSTTEREALAAKEGLVKFQPFVEGEKVTLVTDHAALQWAKTYENSNRRLAAWGTVFSAYAPNLSIVHRPGRKHSNVDPLSRLYRAPPPQDSPARDDTVALEMSPTHIDFSSNPSLGKAAFMAFSINDCLEEIKEVSINTRNTNKKNNPLPENPSIPTVSEVIDRPIPTERPDEYWGATNPPPNILVHLEEATVRDWIKGYSEDPHLSKVWNDPKTAVENWVPGHRFFKDEKGLLFFRDADYQPRLCVPLSQRRLIMEESHEQAYDGAHQGPEKLWQKLSSRFYWKRMKADLLRFVQTCDICQKIKPSNFNKYGYLIPNPIPDRPYQSIAMDFIVNLPWSEGFNAIHVTVDRLTKHGIFTPTTTGLNAEDFGALFVRKVVCRFGLPESIICDRDPRWTSDFWKGVAKCLRTRMSLSSSHHPQHDGQTEIVNRFLEVMLRAFVSDNKESWALWLPLLEWAYNASIHSSTGTSPNFLMLGFEPRSPIDFLLPGVANTKDVRRTSSETWLARLQMHRESARRAIAHAQHHQAREHNKRRKQLQFEEGDKVLVNPHSLEWIESKGEGAKLATRWIGPFEVIQRINPNVYRLRMGDNYPGSPVINIQHLKKYETDTTHQERSSLPDSFVRRQESEEFEVEKIVGHRRVGKRATLQYLIRWANYGPQFDTWGTATDLKNAPIILSDYRAKHNL